MSTKQKIEILYQLAKMSGPVVLYTLVFGLYSIMEVLGLMPQEIKSAGITLPGLFSSYYGDPNLRFITYQLRRTTVTTLLHLTLPLFYTIGLSLVAPELHMLNPWQWSLTIAAIWSITCLIFLCGVGLCYYWYRKDWQKHPLSVQLGKTGQSWKRVALSINIEFIGLEKFVAELGGSTVIITDSWIIQCNVHSVDIIHQQDAVLNVSSADEHRLTLDGQSKQYLTIHLISLNSKFPSFAIRLNSEQYSQLCAKIQATIRVARSVVIQQSLNDRFTVAFAEQVQRNGVYTLPEGSQPLEYCIGCLQTRPQVKLYKMCASIEEGNCRQCFCRPLWCMPCMSKWFAAKQDKDKPETWMSSTAPCPMCRSEFCMLDVLKLQE